MKIYIEKIEEYKVNTKYGEKTSLSIMSNGEKYSCFKTAVSMLWKVGDTIEYEVTQAEKNGKTYNNIILPKVGTQNNTEVMTALRELYRQNEQIIKLLTSKKKETKPENDLDFLEEGL